jgi:hypothetical protein
MKNQVHTASAEKVVSIMILIIISVIIIISGTFFSILSLVNNIYFTVLNSPIHGAIFGLAVIFLGVRYFLSVQKLKAEVYKSTSKFSWNNFKKKARKTLSKNR